MSTVDYTISSSDINTIDNALITAIVTLTCVNYTDSGIKDL
jgi:hypothetical protein